MNLSRTVNKAHQCVFVLRRKRFKLMFLALCFLWQFFLSYTIFIKWQVDLTMHRTWKYTSICTRHNQARILVVIKGFFGDNCQIFVYLLLSVENFYYYCLCVSRTALAICSIRMHAIRHSLIMFWRTFRHDLCWRWNVYLSISWMLVSWCCFVLICGKESHL